MTSSATGTADTSTRKQLAVCIPTWNRSAKLKRLLARLVELRMRDGLDERVAIVVSDNGSTDDTEAVCAEFGEAIVCIRHESNIGFDRNCVAVLRAANASYVLFFADDDMPREGLLVELLKAIEAAPASAIVFSFIQPPYTERRRSVETTHACEHVVEEHIALKHLIRYPKLSTYCINNEVLTEAELALLEETRAGSGYLFVALAMRVFMRSGLPLTLIQSPLAISDGDAFEGFRFSPLVWARLGGALSFEDLSAASRAILARLPNDELWAMLWGALQRELGILTFDAAVNAEIDSYLAMNRKARWGLRYCRYAVALVALKAGNRLPGGRICTRAAFRLYQHMRFRIGRLRQLPSSDL